MRKEKLIKLKIDFYADTFRSGTIEIPRWIEEFDEEKRRKYILRSLKKKMINKTGILYKNLTIITCKYA